MTISDTDIESTLRYLHARGFIHGDDMPTLEPMLHEVVCLGFAKLRDPVLSAAMVAIAGADQPDLAAEAASLILKNAETPSPFGHSELYDLTENVFLFLESRSLPPPHCGRIRDWTRYCHGPGRCACSCEGCLKGQG